MTKKANAPRKSVRFADLLEIDCWPAPLQAAAAPMAPARSWEAPAAGGGSLLLGRSDVAEARAAPSAAPAARPALLSAALVTGARGRGAANAFGSDEEEEEEEEEEDQWHAEASAYGGGGDYYDDDGLDEPDY